MGSPASGTLRRGLESVYTLMQAAGCERWSSYVLLGEFGTSGWVIKGRGDPSWLANPWPWKLTNT